MPRGHLQADGRIAGPRPDDAARDPAPVAEHLPCRGQRRHQCQPAQHPRGEPHAARASASGHSPLERGSDGRWEGDTLVVESTNFNGRTRMAIGGDFYSPNALIIERFRMVDANTINWTMTITDSTVFTQPWTITSAVPMRRLPPPQGGREFDDEDTCHEGNVPLVHLKNVYDQARQSAPTAK